jgi:hypothetical protein
MAIRFSQQRAPVKMQTLYEYKIGDEILFLLLSESTMKEMSLIHNPAVQYQMCICPSSQPSKPTQFAVATPVSQPSQLGSY